MGLQYLSKIDPIFPRALHHIMMSVIHETKPVSMRIHYVKGFHDPSTYAREKWGVKISTNFWTPCSFGQIMVVSAEITFYLLKQHSFSDAIFHTADFASARSVGCDTRATHEYRALLIGKVGPWLKEIFVFLCLGLPQQKKSNFKYIPLCLNFALIMILFLDIFLIRGI